MESTLLWGLGFRVCGVSGYRWEWGMYPFSKNGLYDQPTHSQASMGKDKGRILRQM